eukprot:CAMPEP_0204221440 /NCGR_PEP_ID=MMETSP0361-20130328/81594_1 /ASSEMBLY_ACC=CAM_ASM_000343 /TAXON_ID=268821 /ORGANISM="Scrippsiella Hangoei, Strain SHTV-5" /LENGTH=124 /DNA_ID=CAMNT_0051186925 /DNA_START=61 /DNA_END=430 /DNA_ORIENTATION=+
MPNGLRGQLSVFGTPEFPRGEQLRRSLFDAIAAHPGLAAKAAVPAADLVGEKAQAAAAAASAKPHHHHILHQDAPLSLLAELHQRRRLCLGAWSAGAAPWLRLHEEQDVRRMERRQVQAGLEVV